MEIAEGHLWCHDYNPNMFRGAAQNANDCMRSTHTNQKKSSLTVVADMRCVMKELCVARKCEHDSTKDWKTTHISSPDKIAYVHKHE